VQSAMKLWMKQVVTLQCSHGIHPH